MEVEDDIRSFLDGQGRVVRIVTEFAVVEEGSFLQGCISDNCSLDIKHPVNAKLTLANAINNKG